MEREGALCLFIKIESGLSTAVKIIKKIRKEDNLYGKWFNCDASGGEYL